MNDNVYRVVACARENQGQFMCAYSKRFDGTQNIAEAEAVGMKKVDALVGRNEYGARKDPV
jgi:hypothetical protein